jgi:NADH-quinone oxidoreductase subunit M
MGVQMAIHVMVRMGLMPLPDTLPHELSWLNMFGLFASVYAAVLAICQYRLRRLLALVAASQSAALFVGLASANLISLSGALTQAISVATTSKCLLLLTAAIETRIGVIDIRQMGGIARAAPRLTVVTILLALSAAGIPGSLGFVGEDLLLQGITDRNPIAAFFQILSTALCAIALIRAIMRTFFGTPPEWANSIPDLRGRESVLVGVAVIVIALGLFPQPLIDAYHSDVSALMNRFHVM